MSQLPVTAIEIADYTGILVGAAIALNALEQLLFVRAGTGDLFSRWELLKLRFKATSGWFGQILGILFENGRFSGVLVFRLGTGALMVLCWYTGEFRSLSAGLVVIANSLFLLRSPYGTDGADQMMQIICVALFIGSIAGTDIGIKGALWFIAAQSVLSYFVSGFAKISSNTWRSGRALDGIFKTRMYGDQWFDNYLSKKNGRAVLASWAVIQIGRAHV